MLAFVTSIIDQWLAVWVVLGRVNCSFFTPVFITQAGSWFNWSQDRLLTVSVIHCLTVFLFMSSWFYLLA